MKSTTLSSYWHPEHSHVLPPFGADGLVHGDLPRDFLGIGHRVLLQAFDDPEAAVAGGGMVQHGSTDQPKQPPANPGTSILRHL